MDGVYVVDYSAVCSTGSSVPEIFQSLLTGKSGIEELTRFSTKTLAFHNAACVKGTGALDGGVITLNLLAQALKQLKPPPEDTLVIWSAIKGNTFLVEETSRDLFRKNCMKFHIDESKTEERKIDQRLFLPTHYTRWICDFLNIPYNGLEVSAACASSSIGLAIGAMKVALGHCSSVLVCSSEIVSRLPFTGFSALNAMGSSLCRPFDKNRNGFILGDGAGAMLIVNGDVVRKNGYKPLAMLVGWSISNDATNITAPARDGCGLIYAIQRAIDRAELIPENIQAVCAHGTGTVYNDAMELVAFEKIFMGRIVPMFSIKGSVGHTSGAAGIIEAAICVEALLCRKIPPTVGLLEPEDTASGLFSEKVREFPGNNILTTNSGLGGVNTALIFEKIPEVK